MTKKPKKPPGKSRPARTAARKSSAKAPPAKTSPAKTKARASAAQSAKRKPPPPTRDPLDDFIDVAARAFGLPVEPEWQPAIKASLDVTLRLGALVAAFELPDVAEPAPIFGA
jgi:hypothetical protein